MSLEVIEERLNPLLSRREVRLLVHHPGTGTPDRITVRRLASDHFKTEIDNVYVRSISTRTGGSAALCKVEIYNSVTDADRLLPKHIKNRNLPLEQRAAKKEGESARAEQKTEQKAS